MAKTLDNITAVMIAFQNFENVAGDPNIQTMESKVPMNIPRRSLEPVQEEYLESEIDTPLDIMSGQRIDSKLSLSKT